MKSYLPCALASLVAVALPMGVVAAEWSGILDGLGEISGRGISARDRLYSLSSDDFRDLVTRGLKAGNPRARAALLRAVSDLKRQDLYPQVIEAGRSDRDWRVKEEAMLTARDLKGDGAVQFVREETDDANPVIQALALRELSNFGFKEDRAIFKKKMRSDDPLVILTAAAALVRLGEKIDHKIPLRYIDSDNVGLRDQAIELLGETGTRADYERLSRISGDKKSKGSSRFAAMVALVEVEYNELPSEAGVQLLKERLADPKEPVRDWAAMKLLEFPEERGYLVQISRQAGHIGMGSADRAIRASETAGWRRLHSK